MIKDQHHKVKLKIAEAPALPPAEQSSIPELPARTLPAVAAAAGMDAMTMPSRPTYRRLEPSSDARSLPALTR